MSIYEKYPNLTIDELAMVAMHGEEFFKTTSKEIFDTEDAGFKPMPINAKEARERNEKYYFTGKPCKNGHICKRYISGLCTECSKERKRIEWNNKSIEEKRENSKRIAQKRKENPALETEKRRNYVNRTREERNAYHQFYYNNVYKFKNNVRINRNISRAINRSLKNKKLGKTWQSFVNFTLEELVNHLEKQFTPEMNWDNYGSYWHIDHIKPLSLCESFEEAWALENLQPLTAKDNLSKNNRYIGHPSNPQWVNKKEDNNDNPI